MSVRRDGRPKTFSHGRWRAPTRAILTALCAAAIAAAVAAPAGAVGVRQGLFQSYEKRSSKIQIFSKWNGVLRRSEDEMRTGLDNCAAQGGSWCTLRRWKSFLRRIKHRDPMAQIRAVNSFADRVAYVTDRNNYGTVDHWATPREFFTRGGDCEDFAIIKYLSLRALGWPTTKMRIVVVMDRRKRQAHAVLVVYHRGTSYILDNQIAAVTRDDEIAHYQPVYSINERYWWFHMEQRPAAN